MMSVYVGDDRDCILAVDQWFNDSYNENWFSHDVVKQMVRDIDKNEVVDLGCMKSPIYGYIPPERLSGGVKGLILLYENADFYTDLLIFGGNCLEWLARLSLIKDFKIRCTTLDHGFIGLENNTYFENTNKYVTNKENPREWIEALLDAWHSKY